MLTLLATLVVIGTTCVVLHWLFRQLILHETRHSLEKPRPVKLTVLRTTPLYDKPLHPCAFFTKGARYPFEDKDSGTCVRRNGPCSWHPGSAPLCPLYMKHRALDEPLHRARRGPCSRIVYLLPPTRCPTYPRSMKPPR